MLTGSNVHFFSKREAKRQRECKFFLGGGIHFLFFGKVFIKTGGEVNI